MGHYETVFHELAMLYVSKQDLTDKTPAELFDIYSQVKNEIKQRYLETKPKKPNISKSDLGL